MSPSKEEQQEGTTQKSPLTSNGEQEQLVADKQHSNRWFTVVTAIVLGVVAIATAWSGYQATRWGGIQSTKYAQANALRVIATREAAQAGQLRLYDAISVTNWIYAYTQGNTALATIYMKRFRSELKPAFAAWLALSPFTNPNAPPGPLLMPQYRLKLDEQVNQLDVQANKAFNEGQVANQNSDDYVLNTVFLASVLFLTAIAERFEWKTVKVVILAVALSMLLFGISHLILYPIT